MTRRPLMLVGPTASGKSALALALARLCGGVELVSVDSMGVYRGMDIGTAKPTAAERAEIRHHGLDIVDPWEEFTVAQFAGVAAEALVGIAGRGHDALSVGGTGLYVTAVVDGLDVPGRFPEVRAELETIDDTATLHARLAELDPLGASRMEPGNRRRVLRALEVTLGSGRAFSSYGPGLDAYPPTQHLLVGLRLARPELDRRIEQRYRMQLAAGLVEEVERLLADPRGLSRSASQALGYKELALHLRGGAGLSEAMELAIRRTRRFARRQERWFNRDPRIVWLDASDPSGALAERVLDLWDRG